MEVQTENPKAAAESAATYEERIKKLMADERASDLFFSVGAPPALKVEGATRYLGQAPATRVEIDALVAELTDAAQREAFAARAGQQILIGIAGLPFLHSLVPVVAPVAATTCSKPSQWSAWQWVVSTLSSFPPVSSMSRSGSLAASTSRVSPDFRSRRR